MKKIYLSLLIGILCSIIKQSSAQSNTENTAKDTIVTVKLIPPPPKFKRAQNVFAELGGQGITFSVNYDTRFGARRNGLGGRLGVGYIAAIDNNLVTIPFSLNYLLGKEKNFFEIGLGATYTGASLNTDDGFFSGSYSNVIGTMSFMYRLQPLEQGFSLRAGFTPVFNQSAFIPYFVGVSLGYTF